jgi:hypothetical protein
MGAILAEVPKSYAVKHHTLAQEISSCRRPKVLGLLRSTFCRPMGHVGLMLLVINQSFSDLGRDDESFLARYSQTVCRRFVAVED